MPTTVDLVKALAGYWRVTILSQLSNDVCPPQRWGDALSSCVYTVACAPTDSCLGSNVCATGYTGDRCASCDTGFFRTNGNCAPCPSSPYAIIVVFVVLALVALGISYFLNKSGISLTLISIGIDYAQVLSIFAQAKIPWPGYMLSIFRIFAAFSINLDLAAPECAVKAITYPLKWAFVELLPVFAIIALLVVYAVIYVYKRLCLSISSEKRHAHLPQLISCVIVMFRVLYFYLTRMALDVFNCLPTTPPDGKTYMGGLLQYPCGGSTQLMLLPLALIAFGLYSVAVPAAALSFLRAKKNIVKYDMILWAKGLGDSPLTNKYFTFRRSYSQLYHHMKPGKMYWEFAILARKLGIVAVVVGLSNTPSYQLSMMLLVLFAAFAAQVKNNPYFSHGDRALVVAEHEAKCLSDPFHKTIEADIASLRAKNTRSGFRTSRFFDPRTVAKASVVDNAILVALDYNSVEAVMLGSAILVCLSGVMFTSSRFTGWCARRCPPGEKDAGAAGAGRSMRGLRVTSPGGDGGPDISMMSNPQLAGGKASNSAPVTEDDLDSIDGVPSAVQWQQIKREFGALRSSVKTLQSELQTVKLAASRQQGQFEDELQQAGSAGGGARAVARPRQRTEFTQIRTAEPSARALPLGRGGNGTVSKPSPLLLARSMRSSRAANRGQSVGSDDGSATPIGGPGRPSNAGGAPAVPEFELAGTDFSAKNPMAEP